MLFAIELEWECVLNPNSVLQFELILNVNKMTADENILIMFNFHGYIYLNFMDQDEETLNFPRMHYLCYLPVIPKSCLTYHHRGSPSSMSLRRDFLFVWAVVDGAVFRETCLETILKQFFLLPLVGKLYTSAVWGFLIIVFFISATNLIGKAISFLLFFFSFEGPPNTKHFCSNNLLSSIQIRTSSWYATGDLCKGLSLIV